MRKIILSILSFVFLAGSAYGAVSGDMSEYVRQDVLNERDRAFMAEIRLGFEQMRHEMQEIKTELRSEIQDVKTELRSEIQDVKTELRSEMDKRFGSLEKQVAVIDERTESTKTTVYWWFAGLGLMIALFGILVGFAIFAPALSEFIKNVRRPSVPIEEIEKVVERMITVKLEGKI